MHEPPEGYGQGQGGYPPPGQGPGGYPPPPGQGGYPPQQPPSYPGQGGYPPQQPPYGGGGGYDQPGGYGGQPGGYGSGGFDQPGGYGGGGGFEPPGQPGGWGPPPEPPRRNSGPIIVVAIVAVLVLLGGGGAIVWALSSDDKPNKPIAQDTIKPSDSPEPSYSSPSVPSVSPSDSLPTPTSNPTTDQSMFVQAGDCVDIKGSAPHLRMLKGDCDSTEYKVLKRFSGTSDRSKCRSISGYTTAFYVSSKKYSFLQYVICLKRQ